MLLLVSIVNFSKLVLFLYSDVVIPTNSPERSSIVLKAGQRVMVLKSPKGIYMQLENGKIIAIRTAFKTALGGANNKTEGNKPFSADKDDVKKGLFQLEVSFKISKFSNLHSNCTLSQVSTLV